MAPQPGTFSAFLQQVEDGDLHQELTRSLEELVAQMHNHANTVGGRPDGKITITLKLKLDGGVFEVVGDIAVAAPKAPRRRSIFFRTDDDRLSVTNGRQRELPMETRDVSSPASRDLRIAP